MKQNLGMFGQKEPTKKERKAAGRDARRQDRKPKELKKTTRAGYISRRKSQGR